jgi:hypothetical protein
MGIQRFRKSRGQSIYDLPVDHPDSAILTLKDLGTRIEPVTGKMSTIDLFITSSLYALNSTIQQGTSTGSERIHGNYKRNKSIAGAEGLQLEE